MPNPNYVKGRRKEYKICKALKDDGWTIVQRSAGSHSPIDIFAIHKKKKLIRLIQAKPEDYPSKKILKELGWLNDEFMVEFDVI